MPHIPARQARNETLIRLALEAGERCFDADFGLCRAVAHPDDPVFAAKYYGHFVSWLSPGYAEALLASGGDVRRAGQIIERICDFQERDPGWPSYGNFYGIAEWGRVDDPNAVAFLAVALGYIRLRHGDRLPAAARKRLDETLELMAVGLVRRKADVFYTNIYLLCLAGKLLLGRLLRRDDLVRLARQEWGCFLQRVREGNLNEYNSPSYTAVHAESLLLVRDLAADRAMRAQAGKALDYVLCLYAAHYHLPSRLHGGSMSRVYRDTLLSECAPTDVMAFGLFGKPLPPYEPWEGEASHEWASAACWTRHDYRPSARARALLFDKRYPFRIQEQNVSYWGRDYAPRVIQRDAVQTPHHTLATQYGVWANYGHYLPFLFTHAGQGRQRAIFVQNDGGYPLIDAWFRQDDRTALGAFFWGLPDYETFRFWWGPPPFQATQLLHLGRQGEMQALRLDGRAWDGRRQPRPGAVIEIDKADIRVRIVLLAPPKDVRAPALRMERQGDGVVVRLIYAHSNNPDRFWRTPPTVLPMLFQVRSGDDPTPWRPVKVSTIVKQGVATLRAASLQVRVPVTLAGREQLSDNAKPPITGPMVVSSSEHITPPNW